MASQQQESEKSSVTLACRFDGKLYRLLQEDAKTKGVSLNSLVSSIVDKYISWERYAEEIGFIPLARETVRLLFDDLDEKRIRKIAEHLGSTIPKELILLMFNKIDFSDIIYFIELASSRYGTVRHTINGDHHDFVVYHSVSKRFTDFLVTCFKAMAEELSFGFEILNADSKILSVRIRKF